MESRSGVRANRDGEPEFHLTKTDAISSVLVLPSRLTGFTDRRDNGAVSPSSALHLYTGAEYYVQLDLSFRAFQDDAVSRTPCPDTCRETSENRTRGHKFDLHETSPRRTALTDRLFRDASSECPAFTGRCGDKLERNESSMQKRPRQRVLKLIRYPSPSFSSDFRASVHR